MRHFDWWVYIVMASPGIFLFVVNWIIFFHNMSGKKWSSGIPLIGGAWIAIACLLSPFKWLALAGFADPGVWMLIAAVVMEIIPHRKKDHDKSDICG